MRNKKPAKLFCLFLAAVLLCAAGIVLPATGLRAAAAETPTSLGLAEHGIKAYRDGWLYELGAKGEVVSGNVRKSDCAGLIFAYFSDLGLSGCAGGASSQVNTNCVFSGDISDGIPRIQGLVLTVPDYRYPEEGIYAHIGIYIGGGEAVDNSDYGVNMRWRKVDDNSSWTAWHVFGNGMKYPVNGWYVMDGKMYHYTNYEYDVNTVVDGYTLGSDGAAVDETGAAVPPDSSLTNDGYATAAKVAAFLKGKGYSGKDSTYELIYGGGEDQPTEDPSYNGTVTGNGVNLRASATTKSAVITTLSKGARVQISNKVEGEKVTYGGQTSSTWYAVRTAAGSSGYISSLFLEERSSSGLLTAPVIASDGGYVTLTTEAEDADIYYTTDMTRPTESSSLYVGPLYLTGYTFQAIAVKDDQKSGISTASVLSDGSIFTDFTSDDWYFNAIDQAVGYGIFRGNGDNTFSPQKEITRGQFVQALANLDGVDLDLYSNTSRFDDVPLGSTFAKAIAWAAETGIVKGYTDSFFKPEKKITREQMCVILSNYAGFNPVKDPIRFSDDSKISSWAKDAVYACRDNGIINGIGGNQFAPKGNATRAHACVITVNYYKL